MIRLLRALSLTGWVVVAVVIVGAAGWVKAWYWPAVVTVRGPVETVEVPVVREVVRWKTRTEVREVEVREAPPAERERAKAREGEDLLTAGAIPPAPHGGTAQVWLAPEGTTRLLFRPNPAPGAELGGQRAIAVGIGLGEHYVVRYRQDLGRLGPLVGVAELGAEMRRGVSGWHALAMGEVRF